MWKIVRGVIVLKARLFVDAETLSQARARSCACCCGGRYPNHADGERNFSRGARPSKRDRSIFHEQYRARHAKSRRHDASADCSRDRRGALRSFRWSRPV